ncbi:TRAP transporter large permease [Rhodoferax sp.]|uniref:TRAP transporter large permease n=1 Tax=Rhodoferax sp. TaxID=50421 RepID=UPI002734FBB1|nr:TRAP transporter large permease [Rhodoferax sp.]MDP3192935.1 TRAP transporter large permease [Rhodoferax sp.]MDP3335883.1 TRAP transporter large permease [Rhodoferax sp.]MDP3864596.1 TRAP transporter large permease [Rhodoferax sp.]
MIVFGVLALMVLLALRVPVAASLGIVALSVVVAEDGIANVPVIAAQSMVNGVNSFVLIAAPFFMLAGEIMNQGGLTRRIFRLARALVGWIPGGLGQVNVAASMFFAGMTGSAVSDAVGLGSMEIKAMKEGGYDAKFSAAITAASSLLGPIIPPSVPMVIYGAVAGASIGSLFLAGLVPGLLMGISLMITVWIYARRGLCPREAKPTSRELREALAGAVPSLLVPLVVVGGIYAGLFTPTEAAVIASAYALVVTLFYRELTGPEIGRIVLRVIMATGALFFIVAATALLGFVVTRSGVMIEVALWLGREISSPTLLLLIIVALYIAVGLFMEPVAAMLLLVPILLPGVKLLGIDLVHFGVITVLALCLGLLTPPVGLVLYTVARISDVRADELAIAVLPFLLPLVLVLLAIVAIPDIALGLPRLLTSLSSP